MLLSLLYDIQSYIIKFRIKCSLDGTLINTKMFKVKEYTDVGCVRRIRIPQNIKSKIINKV